MVHNRINMAYYYRQEREIMEISSRRRDHDNWYMITGTVKIQRMIS